MFRYYAALCRRGPLATHQSRYLDIDGFIDVSAYVRLEADLPDIHYGVLDIQVNFHHEGSLMNVHMLHFFALAEDYPRCASVVPGWKDGFTFPPALTKMRVQYQDRWINVCTQQCSYQ